MLHKTKEENSSRETVAAGLLSLLSRYVICCPVSQGTAAGPQDLSALSHSAKGSWVEKGAPSPSYHSTLASATGPGADRAALTPGSSGKTVPPLDTGGQAACVLSFTFLE